MKMNKNKLVIFLLDNLIWILLFISIILFSSLTSRFITEENLWNILVHSTVLGVMVIGQSFTLLTGNFDLSSESILGLTAIIGAWLLTAAGAPNFGSGWMVSPVVGVLAMLAVGILIGWINGFLITKLKMDNFIVTLAMQIILRGMVLVWNEGETITGMPKSFLMLGGGKIGTIPISVIVMVLLFVIAYFVTRYTRFGRNMYAVGGNKDAALASGVDPSKIIRQVYLISGIVAAVAAWMQLGRIGVAMESLGEGMIFEVQAAAVIGGISLFGGRGSMIGALGGVLLLSSIDSGLNLMRVSGFMIDAVRGLIILLAMLIDAQKVRYKGSEKSTKPAETAVGVD
jgi:ribose/xylose/arabinose/galactoside ABC-type transport system permease subunit